jgi:hypothetical protein
MNMAILTERAREEEKKENKCKFMDHKAQQQELPEAEKLRTPHVQVPSPHAVQNPVPSHGLTRPQNPVQTVQQPEHHEAPAEQH